jgi:hypothetical protein
VNSQRKLIYLLWTVIAVLVIGGIIGGYLLVSKANDLDTTNQELSGSNDSLRRQLEQAKATPSPTETPAASPTPTAVVTPTPATTKTPVPTKTPVKR